MRWRIIVGVETIPHKTPGGSDDRILLMNKKAPKQPEPAKAWRLLNQDGSFNIDRRGIPRAGYSDLYHVLLSTSWGKFFGLLIGVYFGINAIFGFLYFLCGPAALAGVRADSSLSHFLDCFFFSVQTLATIGYGHISPTDFISNILVTFEAFTGLLGLALATGLLFSRFARPTARVAFSRNAIIAPHDGVPSLLFRMANRRANQIVEAQVTLTLSRQEVTAEGETYRNFYDLKLERGRSPLFALSWTVVHPIDSASPFHGMGPDELRKMEVEILVSLTGLDDTFSQSISTRFSYSFDDIVWNATFNDMLSRNPDGNVSVDLSQLSQIRQLDSTA